MNAKFFGALSLVSALYFAQVIPAEAQGCGNGNNGNHFGWRNSGRANHYGWRNNPGRFSNRINSLNQNSYNLANYGYGTFGANSTAARPYWGQQTNLNDKIARIQQRLASGNLSADRSARLQAELTRLQSQQTGFNSYWTNRLTTEQQYLQQLLSSGTLNTNQAQRVQDRLTRIINVQNGITSGTGFYNNPSMLSSLRNILGF